MKTKLFLHIGTNKTGTTALQKFFNQNRETLKDSGLLYPSTACKGAHYALSTSLGFEHTKPEKVDPHGKELIILGEDLQEEVKTSSANYIVMSSENFVLPRDVEPVREFFSLYDTKIIVYLRRHDEWFPSSYNQAVKMVANPPWGRGFSSYVTYQKRKNPRYGSHRELVDRWAKVFGKENIIVRPYERQQNQPDIVTDFLSAIGLEAIAQKMETKADIVNEALSFTTLNLVDIFQRVDVGPEVRSRLISHVLSLPMKEVNKSTFSPVLRRQLVDENMKDYRYIAKKYLGRKDGRLFYAPLPDPEEDWKPPKHPTFMQVVEETIKALK